MFRVPNASARSEGAAAQPVARAGATKRCVVWLAKFLRNALAVIGFLAVVYHLGFNLSVIVSGSMAPTLQGDGKEGSDWILCERVSYWLRDPKRWEVAEFVTDDHLVVTKRVVGLPGERISLLGDRAAVDTEPLPVPPSLEFLRYCPEGKLSQGRECECGEGYFLLGDDSHDSWDSRFDGPVSRCAIRGRAWLIVWPPSRFGFVNDG